MLPPPQFPTAGRFFQPSVVNQRSGGGDDFSLLNTFASPLIESTMRLLPSMLGLDPQVNALRAQEKMEKRKMSDSDLDQIRMATARRDAGTMSPEDYDLYIKAIREQNPDIKDSMIAAASSSISPAMTAAALNERGQLNQLGLNVPFGLGGQQAFAPPAAAMAPQFTGEPPAPTQVPVTPDTPTQQDMASAPEPTPVPMNVIPEQAEQFDALMADAKSGYRDPALLVADEIPKGMPVREFIKAYTPREAPGSTHMSIIQSVNQMFESKTPEQQDEIRKKFDYTSRALFSSVASLNQAAALAQGKTIEGFDEKWSEMAAMSFDQYGQAMSNLLKRDFNVIDKDVLKVAENPENLLDLWSYLDSKSNPEGYTPAQIKALAAKGPQVLQQLNSMSPQAREFALQYGQSLSSNLMDYAGKRADIAGKLLESAERKFNVKRGETLLPLEAAERKFNVKRGETLLPLEVDESKFNLKRGETMLPLEVEKITQDLKRNGIAIESDALMLKYAEETYPLKKAEAEQLLEKLRISNGILLADEQRKDFTDSITLGTLALNIGKFDAEATKEFGSNKGRALTEIASIANAATKKEEELKTTKILWQAAENAGQKGTANPHLETKERLENDIKSLRNLIDAASAAFDGSQASSTGSEERTMRVLNTAKSIAQGLIDDPRIPEGSKGALLGLLGRGSASQTGNSDFIRLPSGNQLPGDVKAGFEFIRNKHMQKFGKLLSLKSFGSQMHPAFPNSTFAAVFGPDLEYIYNTLYLGKQPTSDTPAQQAPSAQQTPQAPPPPRTAAPATSASASSAAPSYRPFIPENVPGYQPGLNF